MMRGCLIKLQNDENPDEALKVTTYKYIFYLLVFNLNSKKPCPDSQLSISTNSDIVLYDK